MRTTWKVIGLAAPLALALAVVVGGTRADSIPAPPSPATLLKAMADAGQPGPEHKKLEPLIGDWTFTLKMWSAPNQPPAELQGTVKRRWIMGGRFVQESVKGECDGKPFEGMGLWGYDSAQEKFTIVRACGLCGTISSGVNAVDASGTRFECATEGRCPLTGETITGRDEVIIESDDKIVMNVFKNVGGQEVKAMEIVSIRQK